MLIIIKFVFSLVYSCNNKSSVTKIGDQMHWLQSHAVLYFTHYQNRAPCFPECTAG